MLWKNTTFNMELFANRCSPDKDISVAIQNVDLVSLQQRLDQLSLGELHWGGEERGGRGGEEGEGEGEGKVVSFSYTYTYTLTLNGTNSMRNHVAVHTHTLLPCGNSK